MNTVCTRDTVAERERLSEASERQFKLRFVMWTSKIIIDRPNLIGTVE